MKKIIALMIVFSLISCETYTIIREPVYIYDTDSNRCWAIAKSTGLQCKNHIWKNCPYMYCNVHCK